ncbi:MAG: Rieske [2Fe-2S] iron-sulfur protein [Gemmatimonadetes bacterium]|nr:Rieske [2Fe-2S] iron-sulfur protein [Gemmatimonadota bacterium]
MSDVKECTDCVVSGRRDFLFDSLRAAAAVIAAIGLAPLSAEAMPVLIRSLSSAAKEKSYPIPAADGVQIDKDNEVILARSGKQVYAFALSCPHQNTALKWEAADNRFQCPKHKSRYRPDGTFIEGRATRGMDRYAVKLSGGTIVVDIDKVFQEDLDKAAWQQAVITVP